MFLIVKQQLSAHRSERPKNWSPNDKHHPAERGNMVIEATVALGLLACASAGAVLISRAIAPLRVHLQAQLEVQDAISTLTLLSPSQQNSLYSTLQPNQRYPALRNLLTLSCRAPSGAITTCELGDLPSLESKVSIWSDRAL